MDAASVQFMGALKAGDICGVRQVPKSDLHNHFPLGGSRDDIESRSGVTIPPPDFATIPEMNRWSKKWAAHFDSRKGRRLLLEAAFTQAARDGVALLEIGEDVWGLEHFYSGEVNLLLETFQKAREIYAPQVEYRMVIGMSRHCPVEVLERWIAPFWGRKEFYSLDLYGDELAQPIGNFAPIYKRAGEEGLVRKAHVGEWGTPEDVMEAVEILNLDEVQHGIAAAASPRAIAFLKERGVRLHLCPTSNIRLRRAASYAEHPIAPLYRAGIAVTINSDDVLAFDSDVSKEYFRLYESGCLTAQELDDIRVKGLKP